MPLLDGHRKSLQQFRTKTLPLRRNGLRTLAVARLVSQVANLVAARAVNLVANPVVARLVSQVANPVVVRAANLVANPVAARAVSQVVNLVVRSVMNLVASRNTAT